MDIDKRASDIIVGSVRFRPRARVICPFCAHTRKPHHRSLTELVVTAIDGRAVYCCHHCGETGSLSMSGDNPPMRKRKDKEQVGAIAKEVDYEWGPEHEAFFEERGISNKTIEKYGIQGMSAWYFSDVGKKLPAVCFNYHNKDKVYAAKVRSALGTEKAFSSNGSPQTLYGIDHVNDGDNIYFVEGEMDVLSMAEAGFSAVTLPSGSANKPCAIDNPSPENDQSRFKCLWDQKEKLDAAKAIYIATDNDNPGNLLAEELARRVGRVKCYRVIFGGFKDANEALVGVSGDPADGVGFIKECVEKAEPWPVDGLYGVSEYDAEIDKIFDEGLTKGSSTGYKDVDELYTIQRGDLSIVTGMPSSGKSEFIDQIMVNLADREGWRFAVCSFENPPAYHICKFIQKKIRKPIFDGPTPKMSREEMEEGRAWVSDHFCFIHQSDGNLASLDDIVERIKAAVLRYGILGVVIDPYNYIARPKDTSQTDWISDMLTELKVVALSYGIHIWFIAHPHKMLRNKDGKIPVPNGNDISGSAAWFAKADCGLTVHRPEEGPVEIHVWKIRWAWVGNRGQCAISYDRATTTYNHIVTKGPTYSDLADELEQARIDGQKRYSRQGGEFDQRGSPSRLW